MIMKHLFFSILFILTLTGLYAQNSSNVLPKKKYTKGKITLIDKQSFEIKDIYVEGDSLGFVYGFNDLKRKIPFSQIEEIEVKKGTKVVSGAIYGTILPLIFIMEPFLNKGAKSDNAGLKAAGILVGGAAIGALIGYSIPVWKTYRFDDSGKKGVSLNYNIRIDSKMVGAQLVINF
jgi:hypothetical protein